MKWAQKQLKWKRAQERLEKVNRQSEKNQCRDKLRHLHFFSAMAHARALTQSSQRLYTPYVCSHCEFAHVGSVGQSVVWMFEGISFRAEAHT